MQKNIKDLNTAEVNLKNSRWHFSRSSLFFIKDELGFKVLGGGWIDN